MIKIKPRRNSKNPLKDPNEPSKPSKPYIRYARTVWEKVQSEHPELNIGSIGKFIGQMWRNLPEGEKEQFIKQTQIEQIQYEEDLKNYQKSNQFKEFQRKKELMKIRKPPQPNVNEKPETKNIMPVQTDRPMPIKKEFMPDYSFLEAQLDSDEEDDYKEWKLEAYERYSRNQAFMLDLFNESRVSSNDNGEFEQGAYTNPTLIDHKLSQTQESIDQISMNHAVLLEKFQERTNQFQLLIKQQDHQLVSALSLLTNHGRADQISTNNYQPDACTPPPPTLSACSNDD